MPFRLLPLLCSILLLVVIQPPLARAEDSPIYELRIYTCAPGKLDALNERFANHTMQIFARHGIENVAYWVPTAAPKSKNTLIYLLRHESSAAAKESWDGFRADPEWKQVAAKWQEKHGRVVTNVEFHYLTPTDYSPQTKPVDRQKLYELRIYKAADGKLADLNERFRSHTDKIFQRHGMRSIGYWVPSKQPSDGELLIYVLEYEDRDTARKGWQAFGQDPDWKQAREASEVNGSLLAERPDSTYMRPTDYTPQD